MGDALATVARHLLEDGISACYPNVSTPIEGEPRFHVSRTTTFGDEYLIRDTDLNRIFSISRNLLADPQFDLVFWYQKKIDLENHYNLLYDQKMSELQKSILQIRRSKFDPLTNLPEPSRRKGHLVELRSESETHPSMPGLQSITDEDDQDYRSVPIVLNFPYIDDKPILPKRISTDDPAPQVASEDKKFFDHLWKSVRKSPHPKTCVETVSDISEHEAVPRLDMGAKSILVESGPSPPEPKLESSEIGIQPDEDENSTQFWCDEMCQCASNKTL